MTLTLAEYVNLGFELSPADRAEAARLLQSADDEGNNRLGPGWLDEIRSRIADIKSGKVELMDADESFRLMSAELASRRR